MAAPIVAAAGKWVAQQVAAKVAEKAASKASGGSNGGPGGGGNGLFRILAIAGPIIAAVVLIVIGLIAAITSSFIPTNERWDAKCDIDPTASIFSDYGPEHGGEISGSVGGAGGSIDIDPSTIPDFTGKKGYFPLAAGKYVLTSGYGAARGSIYHIGKDFGAPIGTPIYAMADGIVYNTSFFGAKTPGQSGNMITLATKVGSDTYFHTYKHMSSGHDEYFKAGDVVRAGQQIGRVGNTGYVIASAGGTGSHLHLEVWKNSAYKPQPGGNYPPYNTLAGNPAINPDILLNLINAGNITSLGDFEQGVLPTPGGESPLPAAGTKYISIKNPDGSALSQEQMTALNAVIEECGGIPASGGSSSTGDQASGPWGGHENGKIPADALCPPPFLPNSGHLLRCDAAKALNALNEAYKANFGINIPFTDTYRSYEAQVICRQNKGNLCATPGTSNHGWGLAVDFAGGINVFGTAQHEWMRANASKYGWVHPGWAQAGGSKPEPWHWEFTGGVSGDGKTPDSAKAMARTMLLSYGWGDDQYQCLANLWTRESGWNYQAANRSSSARGIPQAMMSVHFGGTNWANTPAGKEYMENPAIQIKWGLDYIKGRYSGPCGAWAHSEAKNWY